MSLTDWIIVIISALTAGIFAEIFFWKEARKKGHKDLIDIILTWARRQK